MVLCSLLEAGPRGGGKNTQRWSSMKKRDWKKYNRELVRRGEFLIGFDFLENWSQELQEMNNGKQRNPFEYPEGFVKFLAPVRVFFGGPFLYQLGEQFSTRLSANLNNTPFFFWIEMASRKGLTTRCSWHKTIYTNAPSIQKFWSC